MNRVASGRRVLAALLAASAVAPTRVLAQAYPSRGMSLIVGKPPGGPTDVSARIIQPVLQRIPGQTVIVENAPGAAGSIGVQRMLNAPADGYRLYLGTPSDTVLAPLSVAAARYQAENLRLVSRLSASD